MREGEAPSKRMIIEVVATVASDAGTVAGTCDGDPSYRFVRQVQVHDLDAQPRHELVDVDKGFAAGNIVHRVAEFFRQTVTLIPGRTLRLIDGLGPTHRGDARATSILDRLMQLLHDTGQLQHVMLADIGGKGPEHESRLTSAFDHELRIARSRQHRTSKRLGMLTEVPLHPSPTPAVWRRRSTPSPASHPRRSSLWGVRSARIRPIQCPDPSRVRSNRGKIVAGAGKDVIQRLSDLSRPRGGRIRIPLHRTRNGWASHNSRFGPRRPR